MSAPHRPGQSAVARPPCIFTSAVVEAAVGEPDVHCFDFVNPETVVAYVSRFQEIDWKVHVIHRSSLTLFDPTAKQNIGLVLLLATCVLNAKAWDTCVLNHHGHYCDVCVRNAIRLACHLYKPEIEHLEYCMSMVKRFSIVPKSLFFRGGFDPIDDDDRDHDKSTECHFATQRQGKLLKPLHTRLLSSSSTFAQNFDITRRVLAPEMTEIDTAFSAIPRHR